MSDEKKLILDMLNQGKISVEEAQSLLEALGKADTASGPQRPPAPPRPEPVSIMDDIVDTIRTGLSNINFSFGDSNRIVLEEVYTGSFTSEQVELDLMARNGSIRVEDSNSSEFRLEIVKRIRAGTREQAEQIIAGYNFAEFDGGKLRAGDYESKSAGSRVNVSLKLWLPRNHVYSGKADSKNGGIEVNGVDIQGFNIGTMNGSIKLAKVTGDKVSARTVNGSLRLDGSLGRVTAKTTNGSINLVNMAEDCEGSMETVNGRITVQLPARPDIGISIDARTTSGSVRLEHQTLKTLLDERRMTGGRSVEATTANWHNAEHKVELKLRSVNGSIRIEELE